MTMHIMSTIALAALVLVCAESAVQRKRIVNGWQYVLPQSAYITAAPALASGSQQAIYVSGVTSEFAYAVSINAVDGDIIWETNTSVSDNENGFFLPCSKTVGILGGSSSFAGVSLSTGEVLFTGNLPSAYQFAAMNTNNVQSVFISNGFLVASIENSSDNTMQGTVSISCDAASLSTTPGAADFTIFTCPLLPNVSTTCQVVSYFPISLQSYGVAFTNGNMYSIRLHSGSVDWQTSLPGLPSLNNNFLFATYNSDVFVADSLSQSIQCFSQFSGQQLWQALVEANLNSAISQPSLVVTGVVANAMSVVLTTYASGTMSLNAATGDLLWSDSTITMSALVVGSNQIVYQKDHQVFAKHAWFGDVLWSSPATYALQGAAFLVTSNPKAREMVLITDTNGAFVLLNTSLAPAAVIMFDDDLGASVTSGSVFGPSGNAVIANIGSGVEIVYLDVTTWQQYLCGSSVENVDPAFSDGAIAIAVDGCVAAVTQSGQVLYQRIGSSFSYDSEMPPQVFFAGYLLSATSSGSFKVFDQYTGNTVADILFGTACGDGSSPTFSGNTMIAVSKKQDYAYFTASTNCVYRLDRALVMESLPTGTKQSSTVFLQAEGTAQTNVGAVIAGGYLSVFSQSDFDSILWQKQLRGDIATVSFYGPFILVMTARTVDCFLALTGQIVWNEVLDAFFQSSGGGDLDWKFSFYNNTLLLSSGSAVQAWTLDLSVPADQRVLWTTNCSDGQSMAPSITVGPDGTAYATFCENIAAIVASTGAIRWSAALQGSNVYEFVGFQYDDYHNALLVNADTLLVMNASNGDFMVHLSTGFDSFTAQVVGENFLLATDDGEAIGFTLPLGLQGKKTPATAPTVPLPSPTLPPNFVPNTMPPVPAPPFPSASPPRPITIASFSARQNDEYVIETLGVMSLPAGNVAVMLAGPEIPSEQAGLLWFADATLSNISNISLSLSCKIAVETQQTPFLFVTNSDRSVVIACGATVAAYNFPGAADDQPKLLWSDEVANNITAAWLIDTTLYMSSSTGIFTVNVQSGVIGNTANVALESAPTAILRASGVTAIVQDLNSGGGLVAWDTETLAPKWNLTQVGNCPASSLFSSDFAIPDDTSLEQAQRGVVSMSTIFYVICTTAGNGSVIFSGEFSTGALTQKVVVGVASASPTGIIASVNSFYVAYQTKIVKYSLFDGHVVWSNDFGISAQFQSPMSTAALSNTVLVTNASTNIVAFSSTDGAFLFSIPTSPVMSSQPAVFAPVSPILSVFSGNGDRVLTLGGPSCTAYDTIARATLWSVGSNGHCTASPSVTTPLFFGPNNTLANLLVGGSSSSQTVVAVKRIHSGLSNFYSFAGMQSVLSDDGTLLFTFSNGIIAAFTQLSGEMTWSSLLIPPESQNSFYDLLFMSVNTSGGSSGDIRSYVVAITSYHVLVIDAKLGGVVSQMTYATACTGVATATTIASSVHNGAALLLTSSCFYAVFSSYDKSSDTVGFTMQGLGATHGTFGVFTALSYFDAKSLALFADENCVVYALTMNPNAFELSWTFNAQFCNEYTGGVTFTVVETFVVVGSSNVAQGVDILSGSLLWVQPVSSSSSVSIVPPLIGLSNYVYVLTSGSLSKLDLTVAPTDSRVLWTTLYLNVSSASYQYLSSSTGTDVLLVCNQNGLYGVEAFGGSMLWHNTNVGLPCFMIQELPAQPKVVLVTTASSLYAVSIATGEVLYFISELSNAVVSFPVKPTATTANVVNVLVNPMTYLLTLPIANITGTVLPVPVPAPPQSIPPGFHFTTPAPTTVPVPFPSLLGSSSLYTAWTYDTTEYSYYRNYQFTYIYESNTHLFVNFATDQSDVYEHVHVFPDGYVESFGLSKCKPTWADSLTRSIGGYFCSANSSMVAFNGSSGQFLWSTFLTGPPVHTSPSVIGTNMVVLNSASTQSLVACFLQSSLNVTCIDTATGLVVFSDVSSCVTELQPLVGDASNSILLITCAGWWVEAVNMNTITKEWRQVSLQNNAQFGTSSLPLTISGDGGFAVAVCQNNVTVSALVFNTADGTVATVITPPLSFQPVDTQVLVQFPNNAVLVLSGAGGIFAYQPFNTVTNQSVFLWSRASASTSGSKGFVQTSLVVDDLFVFCSASNDGTAISLSVVDLQSGVPQWNTTGIGYALQSCPAVIAPPVPQYPSTIAFTTNSQLMIWDVRAQLLVGIADSLTTPLSFLPRYNPAGSCVILADSMGSSMCARLDITSWFFGSSKLAVSTQTSTVAGVTGDDIFFGYKIVGSSAMLQPLWSQRVPGAFSNVMYPPLFVDVESLHIALLFPQSPQSAILWNCTSSTLISVVTFAECDGILPTSFSVSDVSGSMVYLGSSQVPCLYTVDVLAKQSYIVQLRSPVVAIVATPQCAAVFGENSRVTCIYGSSIQWTIALGYVGTPSAVLIGSLVVFSTSVRMFALSTYNGTIAWELALDVSSFVAVSGGALYVSSTSGLAKVDADPLANSRIMWTLDNTTSAHNVAMAPIVTYSGIVVFTNSFQAVGVDAATGDVIWTNGYSSCSSGAAYNDWVVLACTRLHIINASTGVEVFGSTHSASQQMIITNDGNVIYPLSGGTNILVLPASVPSTTPAPTQPAPTGMLPDGWTAPGVFSGEPTLPDGNVPPALGCIAQTVTAFTNFVGCVNMLITAVYSQPSFVCRDAASLLQSCVSSWLLTLPPGGCSDGQSLLSSVLRQSVNTSQAMPFCSNPATCTDGPGGSMAFCSVVAMVAPVPMSPGYSFPAPANQLPTFVAPATFAPAPPAMTTSAPVTAQPGPTPVPPITPFSGAAFYCKNLPTLGTSFTWLAEQVRNISNLAKKPQMTFIGNIMNPGEIFTALAFNATEVQPFTAFVQADEQAAALRLQLAYISTHGYPSQGPGEQNAPNPSGLTAGETAGISLGAIMLLIGGGVVVFKLIKKRRSASEYTNLNTSFGGPPQSATTATSAAAGAPAAKAEPSGEMMRLLNN